MARFLFSSLVLCLLAALQVAAVALPGPSLPEVIPGPGMPSLASLNLTSAQIRAMPLPVEGKSSITHPPSSIAVERAVRDS